MIIVIIKCIIQNEAKVYQLYYIVFDRELGEMQLFFSFGFGVTKCVP